MGMDFEDKVLQLVSEMRSAKMVAEKYLSPESCVEFYGLAVEAEQALNEMNLAAQHIVDISGKISKFASQAQLVIIAEARA